MVVRRYYVFLVYELQSEQATEMNTNERPDGGSCQTDVVHEHNLSLIHQCIKATMQSICLEAVVSCAAAARFN